MVAGVGAGFEHVAGGASVMVSVLGGSVVDGQPLT